MYKKLKIGKIKIDQQPFADASFEYAAAWQRLSPNQKEADLFLVFEGGYTNPVPYWLSASYSCVCLSSVHCGSKAGDEIMYHFQAYSYQLADYVNRGIVVLEPNALGVDALAISSAKARDEKANNFLRNLKWSDIPEPCRPGVCVSSRKPRK